MSGGNGSHNEFEKEIGIFFALTPPPSPPHEFEESPIQLCNTLFFDGWDSYRTHNQPCVKIFCFLHFYQWNKQICSIPNGWQNCLSFDVDVCAPNNKIMRSFDVPLRMDEM